MTKNQFLVLLDELVETPEGTLTGSEQLDDVEAWDSLAAIGFLGLADRHFGVALDPAQVEEAKTVDDLVALVSSSLE